MTTEMMSLISVVVAVDLAPETVLTRTLVIVAVFPVANGAVPWGNRLEAAVFVNPEAVLLWTWPVDAPFVGAEAVLSVIVLETSGAVLF
jgi:hypothetical protein